MGSRGRNRRRRVPRLDPRPDLDDSAGAGPTEGAAPTRGQRGSALERSAGLRSTEASPARGAPGAPRGQRGSALERSAGLGGTEAAPARETPGAPGPVAGEVALSAGLGRTEAETGRALEIGAGTVVARRYEITARLGAGGMGVVYRAKDTERGEEVALKLMRPALVRSRTAADRFVREARLMQALDHEGIVRVYEQGSDEALGLRFYAMELLDGPSLRQLLAARARDGDRIPLAEVLEITRRILEAVCYAHETTVHRDLKPENVIVLSEDPVRLKILDFGIAKVPSGTQLTVTNMRLGTAYYMAPEQRQDAAEADARADVYSVAVILYELLTGELPVGRFPTPSEERPTLPQIVDRVVMAGLQSDPDERLADGQRFLEAVEHIRRYLGDAPEAEYWIAAASRLGPDAPAMRRLPRRHPASRRFPRVCAWCGVLGASDAFSLGRGGSDETVVVTLPACDPCAAGARRRYGTGKLGMGCLGFLGLIALTAGAILSEGTGPAVATAGALLAGALLLAGAWRCSRPPGWLTRGPALRRHPYARATGEGLELRASSAFLLALDRADAREEPED